MTRVARERWFATLSAWLALGSTACAQTTAAAGERGFCNWQAFERLSDEDKETNISACTPQAQLDLYLRSRYSTRPANNLLLDEVTSLGAEVLPAMLARFETQGSDLTKLDMLEAWLWMQERGHYDVRGDAALLARLAPTIERMRDSYERDQARQLLNELRTGKAGGEDLLAKWTERSPAPRPLEDTLARIPKLFQLMERSTDDEKAFVVRVFLSIRDDDKYDVRADPEVMRKLEAAVGTIVSPKARALAKTYLDALQQGLPTPPDPPAPPASPRPIP